jgi:hypothetical protein
MADSGAGAAVGSDASGRRTHEHSRE